jgi:hypothetical protein
MGRLIGFVIFAIICAFPTALQALTLTLAWDPSTGTGITGYLVSYGTQSGVYTQRLDVGNQTSQIFSQLVDGQTYYFIVQAYDSSGAMSAPSAEVSNGGTTTVPPPTNTPISAVSLTSSVTAPQTVGTTIGWIAAATGGVPPYQFKWFLFDGQFWSALSSWASSSSFGWTPTTANPYYAIGVWARSAWDTADAAEATTSLKFPITALQTVPAPAPAPTPTPTPTPLTGLSLTSSLTAPQPVKTTIQFTASATGGTPPYQFAWWVSDGTQITQLASWSTSNVYYWTPTVANSNYQITVGARSAGSTATVPEISQSVAFPITVSTRGPSSPNQKCNGNGSAKKCQ